MGQYTLNMLSKCLFLVLSLVASLALAMPGGYIADGGVHTLGYVPHYMKAAQHAGQMALQHQINAEAEKAAFDFNDGDESRQARQVPQDVLFFTDHQAPTPYFG